MANILFCVTGPSGSGKTALMKDVMNNEVGSCTSRPMRKGEVEGREYSFFIREDMQWLIDHDQLAEWTEYDRNLYGTTKQELKDKLDNGHAYVICDNHGFHQFKEEYDRVVSIFLYASKEDCFDNMRYSRGDGFEKALSRIATYDYEVSNKGQYDYVVKNIRGRSFQTINILKQIVDAEVGRMIEYESIAHTKERNR